MKPYWSTDRVRHINEQNVYEFLDFLVPEDGKEYSSLYKSALTYFNKNEKNEKYFGQIVTSINMLGLLVKNQDNTFNVSPLGKKLYRKPRLIPFFLSFITTRYQYPRPQITSDRELPISKPLFLIIKILVGLYDNGGPTQAYLTLREFHGLFAAMIKNDSIIDDNLISTILANNRSWGKNLERDILESKISGDLNYDKALFSNSDVITTDKNKYINASDFFIGLEPNYHNYILAKFIYNRYKYDIFEYNRKESGSSVKINNEWSNFMCNEKAFFDYINTINMISSINPFKEYSLSKGFYFEDDLIRRFISSLKSKKYLILTGISGSGKSKIAELYGNYLLENEKGKLLVKAVGSNWNDNKNLLGYVNPLISGNDSYIDTDVVSFIKEANNNLQKIYLLLLDEMNLSYTERYFSDFLSALESLNKEIILPNKDKIIWTDNLIIVGTINEDETTHTLSPKVIDRANIIEMNGSLPSEYFKILENKNDSKIESLLKKSWYEDYRDIMDKIYIATNRKFGYRVIDEITSYIELNTDLNSSGSYLKYLDEQIYQKILPKIHGSRAEVKDIISSLERIITEYNNDNMNLSLEKIKKMNSQLINTGFTSFVNS